MKYCHHYVLAIVDNGPQIALESTLISFLQQISITKRKALAIKLRPFFFCHDFLLIFASYGITRDFLLGIAKVSRKKLPFFGQRVSICFGFLSNTVSFLFSLAKMTVGVKFAMANFISNISHIKWVHTIPIWLESSSKIDCQATPFTLFPFFPLYDFQHCHKAISGV